MLLNDDMAARVGYTPPSVDFTQEYLFHLRGSVGPRPKCIICDEPIAYSNERKTGRQMAMDRARNKANGKRKI
mgnify:CR=1 FL=1